MSNEIPLRQEEYQALSRENQKLHQKIAELEEYKTKNTKSKIKKEREPLFPRIHNLIYRLDCWFDTGDGVFAVIIFCFIVCLTAIATGIIYKANNSDPMVCSVEYQAKDEPLWSIHNLATIHSNGRQLVINKEPMPFATRLEALEFMKKWKVQRCPQKWIDDNGYGYK